jgi:hypothetical protein
MKARHHDADDEATEQPNYERLNYLLARRQWNIGYPISVFALIAAALAAGGVVLQSVYVARTVEAAGKANQIAEQSLESSARPWVGIDGSSFTVIGDIHANPSAVNFSCNLKNGGSSVALGISPAIWVGAGDAGFKLMTSDHCEQIAGTQRQAIKLEQDWLRSGRKGPKPGGVTPETGSILLPNTGQSFQTAPQDGAPTQPSENVYALFCIIYFDEFNVVHVTQTVFCFTNRFPKFNDKPLICGQGNYAY